MRAAGMVQTPASKSILYHVARPLRRIAPPSAPAPRTPAWWGPRPGRLARSRGRPPPRRGVARPHVLDDGLLPPEGIARRVVRLVGHRDRSLHHGAHPLPYPARGLRLVVPDRSKDRQHVGRGHFGHGQRPDARERRGAQTARLGLPVPRSTLKNPTVFRSDMTRFVGRLEPSEIERNPVLDRAPFKGDYMGDRSSVS